MNKQFKVKKIKENEDILDIKILKHENHLNDFMADLEVSINQQIYFISIRNLKKNIQILLIEI